MSSARGARDRIGVWLRLALVPLATWGCGASTPAKTPEPSRPLVEEEPAPPAPPPSAPKPPLSTEGLGFEPGSEVIRGEAEPAVERLAASIGTEDAGPLVRVTVTVDPDPRLCSGVTLARSRAEALRDALIARGVPARRIAIEASTGSSTACNAVGATRASIRVAFIE
jgi:hypothetical protein